MFLFMKAFVADPSCGTVTVTQKHISSWEKSEETTQVWLTDYELSMNFKTHKYPEGKEYVEKLKKKALKKPHPQHPKDKTMKMYRILRSLADQSKKAEKGETVTASAGSASDPAFVEVLFPSSCCESNSLEPSLKWSGRLWRWYSR